MAIKPVFAQSGGFEPIVAQSGGFEPIVAQSGFGPVEDALTRLRGSIITILSLILLISLALMVGQVGIFGDIRSVRKIFLAAVALIILQAYDTFIEDFIGTSPDDVGSDEISSMIMPVDTIVGVVDSITVQTIAVLQTLPVIQ